MRKFLILTTAALLLPGLAVADEGKKPDRPSREGFFQRLDANNDGVVTREEVPPRMQERFDDLLAKADKNGDKQIDKAEFLAARPPRDGEQRPPFGQAWGMRGQRSPQERTPGDVDRQRRDDHPRAQGRHDGDRYAGRSYEGHKRPGGPRPDGMRPKGFHGDRTYALFMRMDQNEDGRLTPREFAKGMEILRQSKHRDGHAFAGHPKMAWEKHPHSPRSDLKGCDMNAGPKKGDEKKAEKKDEKKAEEKK